MQGRPINFKGEIELKQNIGQESNSMLEIILVIVIIVFLIILPVFGKILQWTTGDTSSVPSIVLYYFISRIKGVESTPQEAKAVTIFIVSLISLAVLILILIYKFKPYIDSFMEQRKIQNRFSSERGTARWATSQQLRKLTGKDGVLLGYDIIKSPIPKEVRLSMRASCEHIAIIGPTGCGKTTKFFIPNILTVPRRTSMVITDPKGELEETTGAHLRSRGWETYVFSLDGATNSYNPLSICLLYTSRCV